MIKTKHKVIFKWDNFFTYFFLVLACLAVLLPFSIVISTSFKTYADSVKIPFKFYMGYISLDAYKTIFENPNLWNGLKNTLIITLPIAVIGVFNSALSAYAFAKIRFKFSKGMFAILMGSMMLPGVITMTPAYIIYDTIGWVDTFLPLMVPTAFGTAACVFYLRQYFTTIPNSIIEAAEIDGLSKFGVFTRIILPLSRPALIAQLILWVIAGYNDYFGPMLYLNSRELYTLQLELHLMTGSAESYWPNIMAASIIIMLPMLILYFVAQKQFVEGIVMTGMKE